MINDQMKTIAHELRLFGVHANFEARANQAAGQGLSHLEFLRLVFEDEVLQRKERVAKMLTTRAKFRRRRFKKAGIPHWASDRTSCLGKLNLSRVTRTRGRK